MKLERIVVAVDFLEPGLKAARWAAVHFAPDSALRLVHVIHVPTPPFFLRGLYPSPDELVEMAEEGDGGARGAQAWLAERLEKSGFAEGSIEALVALGDPAFEIVAAATRHDSTLIIMGTRGEGQAARALFGSVANGVLRSAPCPVLTIPASAP